MDRQLKQEMSEKLKGVLMGFHAICTVKSMFERLAQKEGMPKKNPEEIIKELENDAREQADKFMSEIDAAYNAKVPA